VFHEEIDEDDEEEEDDQNYTRLYNILGVS
jgi:hypothetical protein